VASGRSSIVVAAALGVLLLAGCAAFNYASSGNSTVVFTIDDDLVLVDATAGGTAVSADLAVTLAKAIVPAVN